MTAPPPGYNRKTTTAVAPPPGYKRAEPGLIERVGNTYENLFRIAGDTVTRGYLDKSLGPQAQARTQQGREQTSDWLEAPTDIAYGLMSSPYRIAGMGAGAVAGGLEGMTSAYGHQKGWVPDAGNMLWEGGKGAALGAGGAKLGEWAGKWWGGRAAKKAQTYKSDEELEAAAKKSFEESKTSPQTLDLYDRVARTEAARAAQGESRGAFAKLRAGVEDAEKTITHKGETIQTLAGKQAAAEKAAADAIASGKGRVTKFGEMASKVGGRLAGPAIVAETLTSGIPWMSLAGLGARAVASKAGRSAWANRAGSKEVENLAAIIRDPSGQGLKTDPATVQAARDAMAKMMATYGRSP